APISVSDDGRVLRLRGRFVDKVASMAAALISVPMPGDSEIHPKRGLLAKTKKRLMNWVRECREVAAEGKWSVQASGAGFQRAFAETVVCGMTGFRDPVPDEVLAAAQVYFEHLFNFFAADYQPSRDVEAVLLAYGALVEQTLVGLTAARRFCWTEQGRLGQVRNQARKGDLFCVILGAEVPYLLRRIPGKDGSYYTLIGDSFLLGALQGEALSDERYETVDILIE
ncbi:hypothetical protein QBC42DRAFT_311408, partial [Cladorrhinum samala]